jgi:PKD domain
LTTRFRSLIPLAGLPGLALILALTALVCARSARAQPPSYFSITPASPVTNETVTFTSTVDAPAESQTWDLDGNNSCNDATGSSAQRSYPLPGTYRVTLCISASGPTQGWSNTQYVTVLNQPPVAAITYAPAAPLTGDPIVLTSISADPDGPLINQAWDLDADGAFDDASGPTAQVSFSDAGDHLVRLRVTDRDGAVAMSAVTIPVGERPAALLSPFPIVRMTAALGDRGTRIQELVVNAPAGSRVKVRCLGRHCPFRSFARTADAHARAARIVRIRRLSRFILPPGTLIEIRVTKRGEVGKYTRFRVRKGKPPVRVDRCLRPGSNRPVRCPSS